MADLGLVNIVLLEEIEENERRQQHRLNYRQIRDSSNPFDLPNENFRKLFRFRKETALDLINEIGQHLDARRTTRIPDFITILAALNFFGSGSYQLSVGANNLFALSQPSVSRCIEVVTQILVNHFSQRWIKFPTSEREKNSKKLRFQQLFNFPNIIGAIDCSHIAIITPPANNEQYPGRVYFNRKKYASINTQIICDADLNILNINARFPGSIHDSAIWMASTIRRNLINNYLNGDERTHLLGDSGYPLQPWLLTPVNNAVAGTPAARYNSSHKSGRNCIERLNGLLKSRFRCLLKHRTLNYHPIKAANIIYSCAVLHNISLFFNEEEFPMENEDADDDPQNVPPDVVDHPINGNFFAEGRRIRENIIQHYFN